MKTTSMQMSPIGASQFLKYLVVLFLITSSNNLFSQQMIFADSIMSEDHTTNTINTIDSNFYTYSTIEASSGTLLGVGAYDGHIEICFPNMVPANQTVYVKVEMDEDILEPLVGGSLGNLLATVGGVVLTGNQEFTIEAKNNGIVVLSGNSSNPSDFSGEELKIVINEFEETFIAITPTMNFNSIRITNSLGALIGASTTRDFRVYAAYYIENAIDCGEPEYTSFDATGINLQLIQTTGAGATNIHHAIDNDWYSYSELSLGILSVAASIRQNVYFEGVSTPGDEFGIRLSVDPQLAILNLGNNITISANNGNTTVYSENLGNLLTPSMQDSLINGDIATVYIQPQLPVDRIIINFNGLVGVNLDQIIHLHEVFKLNSPPTFDISNSNDAVCKGELANLIANAADSTMQINWYSDSTLTNQIGNTVSGAPFEPLISSDSTFYITASIIGCSAESNPVAIDVSVINTPDSNDLTLTNSNTYCASDSVIISATSSVGSMFNWYFDSNGTQPISNSTIAGVTYSINSNGELIITGLSETNSPYTIYGSVMNPITGCSNAPGDFASTSFSIDDSPAPTTNDTIQSFCSNSSPTVNDLHATGSMINWYDSSGNPLTSSDLLIDGETYYATQTGSNGCESSSQLEVSVIVVTPQGAEIIGDTNQICYTDTFVYYTQPGMVNYVWTVNGATIISGGSSTDDSITVVWTNTGVNSIDVSYSTTSGCDVATPQSLVVTPIVCEGTDVVINKSVDVQNPFIGQHIFFTITVDNIGPIALSNIQVSEQLQSGYTYVNHTTSIGSYNETSGLWDIPTIAGGATETLVIEVIVNPTGNYENTASIITNIPEDGNSNNNSSTIEPEPGCLNVYNEITPNNDGMNDFLHIDCIENYPDNSLTIFNRYGNPVYTVESYQNDWSGTSNVGGTISSGQTLPSGTYFYILKVNDEDFEKNGWIYLLQAQ